jgi:hypothetical protein
MGIASRRNPRKSISTYQSSNTIHVSRQHYIACASARSTNLHWHAQTRLQIEVLNGALHTT